jgi:glucan biosynthesis protein
MIIEKLPKWILTNPSPSFYETEGGTVLEQTAIMYKKVNEVIEAYNGMLDDINTTNEDFIKEQSARQEEFELKVNQMIHDFTTLVELQLANQQKEVENGINYMKDHLDEAITEIIPDVIEGKSIDIDFVYNEETEQLDIKGILVTDGGAN